MLFKGEGNAKDKTIIFLENDSHKVATQYRQRLRIRQNNLIHAIDSIELGNFVITKDYLAKYKETDENMKKVNKWNDIKIKVTI